MGRPAPAGEDERFGVELFRRLGLEHDARLLAEDGEHVHAGGAERVVQALALMMGLAVDRAAHALPAPVAAGAAARLDRERVGRNAAGRGGGRRVPMEAVAPVTRLE